MFISRLHSKIYGQNHHVSPTPQHPSPSLTIPHHPTFNTPHPSPQSPCPIKNINLLNKE